MNNKFYTVCGIVETEGKILLVRHTYGNAEGRLLLPGGYVKEGELPSKAAEREIFEETSIKTTAKSVFAVQFKPYQWCVVFLMEYLSGKPQSDNYENSEVTLLTAEKAIELPDITNMSREILKAYIKNNKAALGKSSYIPKTSTDGSYELFIK